MSKQIRSVFSVVVGLSFVLIGSGFAQAADPWLGTWTLNVAKSKCSPGPCARSQVSRFEMLPDGGLKITSDSVNAAGQATHNETVTMFDGKESEVKGAAVPTTRLFSRIDDHTYEFVTRLNGKVTTTTRGTVSADGKSRRLVTTGMNADGKPVNNTSIYDRQAADAWIGTWKLNVAKSKCSPGPCARSGMSRFEMAPGGGLKVTTDGINAAGQPTHTEMVTMFDGKESEVKGAPVPTTSLYSRIDDHNYQNVARVNGKITTTSRVTVSADGKTRTLVTTGMNADGKPVNNTIVYERQ